jgi:hypothetical protein
MWWSEGVVVENVSASVNEDMKLYCISVEHIIFFFIIIVISLLLLLYQQT